MKRKEEKDYKQEFLPLLEKVEICSKKTRYEISLEMEYGENYIAEMLGPNGKVTAKFLKMFRIKYADVLDNPNAAGSKKDNVRNYTQESVHELAVSNRKLADAHLILAELLRDRAATVNADARTTGEILDSIRGLQNFVVDLAHEVTKKPLKDLQITLHTAGKEGNRQGAHKDKTIDSRS